MSNQDTLHEMDEMILKLQHRKTAADEEIEQIWKLDEDSQPALTAHSVPEIEYKSENDLSSVGNSTVSCTFSKFC